MAIQMRRGAYANLDKSKLVAGEIVMSTDTNYVGIAKAPSQVLQLATTDMLELPVASTNTLGGVKVGDNLSIDSNGRLSATGGGGGTTVIANPTGTATDDLTKIQIGQTIYDIEGGSGDGYTKTLLYYSGSDTTFAPISSNATAFDVDVNFSRSVSNYDILEIWINDETSGGITTNVLPVYVDLETALAKVIDINGWDRRYVRFKIKTSTTFAYFGTNPGGQGDVPRIFKIYGIKFGGGSGSSTLSGLTDVTVSNPTDKHALMYDSTQSKWINRDLFQHDSKILEVYGSFSSGMETTMFLIPPVSDLEYWRRTQLLYFDPEINNKHYPFIMWKYNNGTLQSVGNSFHAFKYTDEDGNERVGEIAVFGAIQNEIPCVQITYQYSITESVTLLTEDILYVTLRAIY